MKKHILFEGPFPLSKAIIHDAAYTMEISGQIGLNLDTGELEVGIEKQTEATMNIIKKILEDEGWNMDNIVKARIFLKDMKDYEKMNDIYASFFNSTYPTRFALAVKELPRNALVEIECTAVGDSINN